MIKESERTHAAREKIGMASKDSHEWGTKAPASRVYRLTLFALLAYPAGCILQLVSEAKWLDAAGLLLVASALFACAPIFASRLYKIVSEEDVKIDEFEQQMRLKSMQTAYQILMALGAAGLIYLAIASDVEALWQPIGYDHFNAIFWGFVLYAMLLPALALTRRLKKIEQEDD